MKKRVLKDIQDLTKIAEGIKVEDNTSVIYFEIKGPPDSLYETGKWKLRLELSKDYPYKSPSVGFITKIYHPNVDFNSGSVCLNVLNQTWTPIYNLCHIYQTFLPQLLLYPNAEDPLNTDAANIYMKNTKLFKTKVLEHIKKHC